MKREDVDFENFNVETERATEIRGSIEKLKASGWLSQFRLLATELGVDEAEDNTLFQEKSTMVKVFRAPAGGPLEGFEARASGADLHVRLKGTSLLEIIELPKAGDFAILHVHQEFWNLLPLIEEHLGTELSTAKKMKGDRQSHFRSFGKSAAPAAVAASSDAAAPSDTPPPATT